MTPKNNIPDNAVLSMVSACLDVVDTAMGHINALKPLETNLLEMKATLERFLKTYQPELEAAKLTPAQTAIDPLLDLKNTDVIWSTRMLEVFKLKPEGLSASAAAELLLDLNGIYTKDERAWYIKNIRLHVMYLVKNDQLTEVESHGRSKVYTLKK